MTMGAVEGRHRFAGSVVVVTGAGRPGGLGEAVALAFASEGAHVVIADVPGTSVTDVPEVGLASTDDLNRVLTAVEASGDGDVLAVPCDVRDPGQVEHLMTTAVDRFGRIDVLVNNAGVGFVMGPLVDVAESDWDLVLDVNLKGVFLCTQAAVRRFIAQGEGGRIITIASQAAKSGFPFAAAYTASKHGVVGFTRSAAVELGRHGITVNAVCPNHVTTGLGAWQNDYFSEALGLSLDEYKAAMTDRIPLGRTGLPQDTASACLFLASDDAGYITGEALNVSGGEEYH
jgi:meso-butanediol dehydrogenase/(S,S)-butanediol dehydrogenase/diacetyl reductase